MNCPKCGAPIDFPTGQEKTVCPYCGSIVTRPVLEVSGYNRIQEAMVYAKRGYQNLITNRKQALRFFNKAIELDPDNLHAWKGKATVLLFDVRVGKVPPDKVRETEEEALRLLQKACELGMDGEALTLRKQLAEKLGKWKEIDEGTYESGY